MSSARRACGFTLIELIMVMVLIGALAVIGGLLIVQPFRASADIARRARLTDQADLITDRITREVRAALPNSVRIGSSNQAVEFISTRTGGRYRRYPKSGGGGNVLKPAQPSGTFDVLGGLPDIGKVDTRAAGTDCANGAGDCITIYNTGQTGYDAYNGDNIAAVTAKTDNVGNDQLTYDTGGSGPAFKTHSPRQRFYVIDHVVSYVCNTAAGTLRRYSDYGLNATQSVPLAGTGALVADDISGCTFQYQPGTSSRQGLLTMNVALTRGGETVTLMAQAHVVNAP